jgi:hypothetical protein
VKQTISSRTLLPLAFALALAMPVAAAPKKSAAPQAIPAAEKVQPTNYQIALLLQQSMIETSFDTGRVARPPAGGLLDSLIVYSMDNKKEVMANSLKEKAERTITPLRLALGGFDVDALAKASTEKAFATMPWVASQGTTLSKTVLPTPAAPRVAHIRYSYDMSPDFSAIRLFAEIDFLREGASQDGKAYGKFSSFYAQSITSIVQLRKRSYEASENVSAWSAEDAKQAKAAFTQAFGSIEALLPFALGLNDADIKAYGAKDREQGFGAGYNGPLIKRGGANADDILIWNKGLLFVHTLP